MRAGASPLRGRRADAGEPTLGHRSPPPLDAAALTPPRARCRPRLGTAARTHGAARRARPGDDRWRGRDRALVESRAAPPPIPPAVARARPSRASGPARPLPSPRAASRASPPRRRAAGRPRHVGRIEVRSAGAAHAARRRRRAARSPRLVARRLPRSARRRGGEQRARDRHRHGRACATLLAVPASAQVSGARVTTVPPGPSSETGEPSRGRTSSSTRSRPNPALRNADLPTRDHATGSSGGGRRSRSTCTTSSRLYGDDDDARAAAPARAACVSALHAPPAVTRTAIEAIVAAAGGADAADPRAYLAATDLAEQVELRDLHAASAAASRSSRGCGRRCSSPVRPLGRLSRRAWS